MTDILWQEIEGSNPSCENLLVRGNILLGGSIIPPPGGGGGGWQDDGATVRLITPADRVVLGALVSTVGVPFEIVLTAATRFIRQGSVDAFAREQLWFTGLNSVLRLGADAADGDPFSADSEGIVCYHPTGDQAARIKADRLGLTRASDTSLYYFRADQAAMFYRANPPAGRKHFYVARTDGFAGFGTDAPHALELFRVTDLARFDAPVALSVLGADPAAIVGAGQLYAKDPGTSEVELFWRTNGGAVSQLTPVAAPAAVVSWTAAKSWAQVYAEIQAVSGPVLCLVEDAGVRTMTKEAAGTTNLWRVQFMSIGLSRLHVGEVHIQTQAGLTLGGDGAGIVRFQSQNVRWTLDATLGPLCAAPATPIAISMAGGQLDHLGAYAFETADFRAAFSEGCIVIGTGGIALVRLTADASQIHCSTWSRLVTSVFASTTGVRSIGVTADWSCQDFGPAFDAPVAPNFLSQSIAISPNGTAWTLSVDDLGVLSIA